MVKSVSSRRWVKEHHADPYVKRARDEGYRSRAAYKLLELDERDKLLRPGLTVVDLGAAPGGWSQVAAAKVGAEGRVFALDLLVMDPVPGVEFLQGDFTQEAVLKRLLESLPGTGADLVMSDMAPNISGMKAVDQPRAMLLAELALELAREVLKPGGDFVAKVFQGEGFDALLRDLRSGFRRVYTRKPRASRPRSPELYVFGRGYGGV